MNITASTLIIAPLDIKVQSDFIISIFEYIATPNVAAKNPRPLTIIDGIDVASAILIAESVSFPLSLSALYLVSCLYRLVL